MSTESLLYVFRKVVEKTVAQKAVLLVDSIHAQTQYNIGRNALSMITKILQNTASVRNNNQHN